MTEVFLTIVFMIPLYGLFFWMYYCPEESILFGRRWMYKDEPEISDMAIQYTKFTSISLIIGSPIVLISLFSEIHFLRFSLVILPLVLMLGAIKIFSRNNN